MRAIFITAILLHAPNIAAYTIVQTVEVLPIRNEQFLFGTVKPQKYVEIRPKWMALISKFHVKPGDTVAKGDLLATGDLQYVDKFLLAIEGMSKVTESNYKQAKDAFERAKKSFASMQRLVKRGIEPRTKLADEQKNLIDIQASMMTSKFAFNRSLDQLKDARDRREQVNFYSPIAGIVEQMDFNPSQVTGAVYASNSHLIARVVVPGSYTIEALALDTQIKGLNIGDQLEVYLAGINQPITGRVGTIQKPKPVQNKEVSGEFLVSIDVRTTLTLPSTARAKVAIRSQTEPKLVVPWNGVQTENGDRFVRMADKSLRKIRIGATSYSHVEVVEGLEAGDEIMVDLW